MEVLALSTRSTPRHCFGTIQLRHFSFLAPRRKKRITVNWQLLSSLRPHSSLAFCREGSVRVSIPQCRRSRRALNLCGNKEPQRRYVGAACQSWYMPLISFYVFTRVCCHLACLGFIPVRSYLVVGQRQRCWPPVAFLLCSDRSVTLKALKMTFSMFPALLIFFYFHLQCWHTWQESNMIFTSKRSI